MLRALPRKSAPLGPTGAEVLRLITVQRVPVCLTVHANGRRRYGYWQNAGTGSGLGGCYVALPTDECDALHAAGRIVLGDPVTDPAKTTYPVRPVARVPASSAGAPRPSSAGAPRPSSAGAPRPSSAGASRPSSASVSRPSPAGLPRRALTA